LQAAAREIMRSGGLDAMSVIGTLPKMEFGYDVSAARTSFVFRLISKQ
jgi:hypothetical protein